MHWTRWLFVAVSACILTALTPMGTAKSQVRSIPVDSGVIFSAELAERDVQATSMLGVASPFWTPTVQQIAQLEDGLKSYLQSVGTQETNVIVAGLSSYKRQYFGYFDRGKKWILVNAFCEEYWNKDGSWHGQIAIAYDGGPCFFRVHYDPLTSQFDRLEINGEA